MSQDLNLYLRLLADTKQANKSVASIDSKMSKFGKTITKLGAGLGIAVGAKQAIDWMGDAISKSEDLTEAQSKNEVVFGDSASKVRNWAANLDTAYGVSIRQASKYAGTLGQISKSMGLSEDEAADYATSLVQMGTDIASFSNVSVEQALDALRSGLTGEYEPLKQLGGLFSKTEVTAKAFEDGIIGLGEELDRESEALAYQALLWEQFGDAIGDAVRTQDTATGQARVFSAELDNLQTRLGESLVPLKSFGLSAGIWLADQLAIALQAAQDLGAIIQWLFQDSQKDLQQFASDLREVFVAPSAGRVTELQEAFISITASLGMADDELVAFRNEIWASIPGLEYMTGTGELLNLTLEEQVAAWEAATAAALGHSKATATGAEETERLLRLGGEQKAVLDDLYIAQVSERDILKALTTETQKATTRTLQLAMGWNTTKEAVKEAGETITSWMSAGGPVRETIDAFYADLKQQRNNIRYFLNETNLRYETKRINQELALQRKGRRQAIKAGNQEAIDLYNANIKKLKALKWKFSAIGRSWAKFLKDNLISSPSQLGAWMVARMRIAIDILKRYLAKLGFKLSPSGVTPSASSAAASASGASNVTINISGGDIHETETAVLNALRRHSRNNGGIRMTPYSAAVR